MRRVMSLPSYVRPVGASDGCGTVTVDAAAMARKITAVEKRRDDLEAALVALIDAVDARDQAAIETALFVGRGLTF
jgi:precorrin-6B methylase 2